MARAEPRCLQSVAIALRPFMKTPARSAVTSIYLASAPEVKGVTGRYFAKCQPKTPNKAACDTATAARLWQISADLVGLTTEP
jgi:hypothetical protein